MSEPQCLEAERGYNLTVPTTDPAISHALVFADRGVAATQLDRGLRLGGWDELGGAIRPPDPKLFARLRRLAATLIPGPDWAAGIPWMGMRPSLPDGLPVIGRSRRHSRIFYAFGHGHLGMTQGPATGEMVADMIAGNTPAINPAPFAPR